MIRFLSLLCVLVSLPATGIVSASTTADTETHAGAFDLAEQVRVEAALTFDESRWGCEPFYCHLASDSPLVPRGTTGFGGRTLSAAEQAKFDAFAVRARAQGLVENPNRTGSWEGSLTENLERWRAWMLEKRASLAGGVPPTFRWNGRQAIWTRRPPFQERSPDHANL